MDTAMDRWVNRQTNSATHVCMDTDNGVCNGVHIYVWPFRKYHGVSGPGVSGPGVSATTMCRDLRETRSNGMTPWVPMLGTTWVCPPGSVRLMRIYVVVQP